MMLRSAKILSACVLLALVGFVSMAKAETLQERQAALYEKAAGEGSVVFYTSDSQGLIRALSAYWKSKFPKVELSIIQKPSASIATDIEAQRAAGKTQGDVFDFTLPYVAVDWKEKGHLLHYKPHGFDALSAVDKDPDGAFIVKSLSLLSAAYNADAITDPAQLPRKLSDLLDPKWKNKMIIAHPTTAANTRTYFMAMLHTGAIDWTFMEKLAQQNILFTRNNGDTSRMMVAGERVLSPMLSSHNVFSAVEKGQKLKFIAFTDGSPVSEEVAGILRDAPHPNAAKLLMEVLASAEGQELLLKPEFMWPTHPAGKPGPLLPNLAEVKTVRVEMKLLVDKQAAADFLKRFDETFRRN